MHIRMYSFFVLILSFLLSYVAYYAAWAHLYYRALLRTVTLHRYCTCTCMHVWSCYSVTQCLTFSTRWERLANCSASSPSIVVECAPFFSVLIRPMLPWASGRRRSITFCSSDLPRIAWIPPLFVQCTWMGCKWHETCTWIDCRFENHNSLGCKQPLGVDIKQSPNAQDMFQPIPGLISCAGVTGSVGITRHAHATQMAGLSSS